jgi:hypothetical protein
MEMNTTIRENKKREEHKVQEKECTIKGKGTRLRNCDCMKIASPFIYEKKVSECSYSKGKEKRNKN